MATSTRRTVVRNNGNINKGGSKTIYSYNKEGSVSSIRTVRGSLNNKRGGADNQYSITTETRDAPPKNSPAKREPTNNAKGSGSSFVSNLLFGLLFGLVWLIIEAFEFLSKLFA